MEVGNIISAQIRKSGIKGKNRKLRAMGQVPAICYGLQKEPVSLSVDIVNLRKALDPRKGRNTLLRIQISSEDGVLPRELPALVKEVQYDSLGGDVLHVDFIQVEMNQLVRVQIPIALVGKAEGVKEGGTLHQVYRELPMLCLPGSIPLQIEMNIDGLKIGESIHVSELNIPEGSKVDLDAGTTICVVTAPQVEKEPKPGETPGAVAPAASADAAGTKEPSKPEDSKSKTNPPASAGKGK